MKFSALFFLLISCHAQAITGEYSLLDITDCKSYDITSDAPVYRNPDSIKYQKELDDRKELIHKLLSTHDESWLNGHDDDPNYEGWAVYTDNEERYIGLCKDDSPPTGGNPSSFQCDGDSKYPLQELSCKVGQGNRWYEKCSAKGKVNHDIRLYWVDTAEYEDGGSPDVNEGYGRDLARMKFRCKNKQGRLK
jgi:hypothetical protein